MASWHVFRRLPGAQGANDCWSRVSDPDAPTAPFVAQAETADDAIAIAAARLQRHLLRADFFAVRAECVSEIRFVGYDEPERPPIQVWVK